jgi:hypothetical protein
MDPYIPYLEFRSDPSNDQTTDGMWAGQNNLRIEDLKKWKSEHPTELFTVLTKRRSRYAEKLIEVDQALFEKAKGGDARSVELLWSRFEGWSPKIEENNAKQGLGKTKTLADLMGDL